MNIASAFARFLIALIFFVFGLNVFLHFIPMPPPSGLAGDFMKAMFFSGYMNVVGALEVAGAILLLFKNRTPLALILLIPVIVNIVLFHIFMAPSGLPMAVVVTVLSLVVLWDYRPVFLPILNGTSER